MWSLQLFEGCLQSVRTEAQLPRSSKECNKGTLPLLRHSPRKKSRRWKHLLLHYPTMSNSLEKVRALDQRLEGCRGAIQRASKAKQAANAQQQAAQAAFEKAETDESRIRAELAELEKRALSQTTQPTCLQTISCKAAPLRAAVTELSRQMPATGASPIQTALDGLLSLIAQAAEKASRAEAEGSATCVWDCDDEDLDLDTPDDVLLDTVKRGSEGDAQEMLRTVRRRIRAKQCSDVPRRKAQQDDADDSRVGKHCYTCPQG